MNRSIIARIVLCGLFGTLSAADLSVDNGCIKATFVSPDGDEAELGGRFCRAGWLRSLYLHGDEKSFFRTESLFDDHPAFGCPQEFLPALSTGKRSDGPTIEKLKVGVGIIEQDRTNPLKVKCRKIFPWRVSMDSLPEVTRITYRQDSGEYSGYAYTMTVKISIPPDSPVILYDISFHNSGTKPLTLFTYVHPFFNAPPPLSRCWYTIPDRQPSAERKRWISAATPEQYAVSRSSLAAGSREVSAGGFPNWNDFLTIGSTRDLEQVVFWRRHFICFAVEPFLKLKIAPGEKLHWGWKLIFGTRN